jgi:hypothetical protein
MAMGIRVAGPCVVQPHGQFSFEIGAYDRNQAPVTGFTNSADFPVTGDA